MNPRKCGEELPVLPCCDAKPKEIQNAPKAKVSESALRLPPHDHLLSKIIIWPSSALPFTAVAPYPCIPPRQRLPNVRYDFSPSLVEAFGREGAKIQPPLVLPGWAFCVNHVQQVRAGRHRLLQVPKSTDPI
jgi:hypothetical protein